MREGIWGPCSEWEVPWQNRIMVFLATTTMTPVSFPANPAKKSIFSPLLLLLLLPYYHSSLVEGFN